MGQKVKWLGSNLKDDATHRLVTDTQIEKWDKVDSLEADEWIELTPTNIGQYTCTKEDEYWTDMGVADGTIFDSTSLDEGNYIIKLGLDKLVPNTNTVSSPSFRFGSFDIEGFLDMNSNYENIKDQPIFQLFYQSAEASELKIYNAIYLNYLIETQAFIFLCQFFGVKLSITDLLYTLVTDYEINCVLMTEKDLSKNKREILFPECIKIKIVKEQFGPNNDKFVYKKYLYADMISVDYNSCYNYKWNIETHIWEACDYVGVPQVMKYKQKQAKAYYTENIDSKVSREYIEHRPRAWDSGVDDVSYSFPMEFNAAMTEFRNLSMPSSYLKVTPTELSMYNGSFDRYGLEYSTKIPYGSELTSVFNGSLNNMILSNQYLHFINMSEMTYEGEKLIIIYKCAIGINNIRFTEKYVNKDTGELVDEQEVCVGMTGIDTYKKFKKMKTTTWIDLKNRYSISIKVNEETTYKYNNEEDVEIDLSSILSKDSNVVTDWNTAITNGEYYSLENSTNAPSTKELMGTVVRGKKSIVQTVYIDGEDEANSFHQFIRKGIISVGEDDTEVVTWKEWNELEYCIGSDTSANN